MYDALCVAEYIIRYCKWFDIPMSNLKLQQVLYFVQAEFLVGLHKPCFHNTIIAWDFGPIVPEVYHMYKCYGGMPIYLHEFYYDINDIDEHHRDLIDNMIDKIKEVSYAKLVDIIHNQMPWKRGYYSNYGYEIKNKDLIEFFTPKK